jgi:isoleucyl-tRNA synthetase
VYSFFVAYANLHSCLVTLSRLLAPFVPFISEELYQNLVRSVDAGAPVSVHLTEWPVSDESLIDLDCVAAMDQALKVCTLGHAARNEAGIKIRQPLAKAVVAGDPAALERIGELKELIKDELNVKDISLLTERGGLVDYKVRPLPKVLGAKYGSLFPKILPAIEATDQNAAAQVLRQGGSFAVKVGDTEIKLEPSEVEVIVKAKPGLDLIEDGGMLVGIDTNITDELTEEGLVRDIVRRIQNQRKEAGFKISDLINTYYSSGPKLAKLFESYGSVLRNETLSKSLVGKEPPAGALVKEYELAGEKLRLGLTLAS